MGYYLPIDSPHGKAALAVERYGAKRVTKAEAEAAMSDPKLAVIIVVDNGAFSAAGFLFDQGEWDSFSDPSDPRPREFLTMDRDIAKTQTGFPADRA